MKKAIKLSVGTQIRMKRIIIDFLLLRVLGRKELDNFADSKIGNLLFCISL